MPRKRRSTEESAGDNPLAELASDETRKSRRSNPRRKSSWMKRLGILGLVLLALVLILPNLIGWTPLKGTLLKLATKDFQGEVTVESLSLGWFQSIEMGGLKVRDSQGNVLAEVEKVRSTNRLYSFLLNQQNLGQIEVVNPKVILVTRENGSNWEDAIVKYLEPPAEPTPAVDLPRLTVLVTGGQVSIASTNHVEPWRFQDLKAEVHVSDLEAIRAHLTAQVARGESFGTLTLQALLDSGAHQVIADNGQFELVADQVDLGFLAPIAERLIGQTTLVGNLSGSLKARFASAGAQSELNAENAVLTEMQIANPSFLKSDKIVLSKVTMNGEILSNPHGLVAKQFQIISDVGRLSSDGTFDWEQFKQLATTGELIGTTFQLDGQLDLAKVSQMLPDSLQLYDDLTITTGNARCQINSRPANGAGRIVVNVDTDNLVAERNGQRLAWQQPFRLVTMISQNKGNWELEEVRCDSDFLTLSGKANLHDGTFTAQGDLSLLTQRLGQFVDLQGWNVRGKLDGSFGWHLAANSPTGNQSLLSQPIQIEGNFNIIEPTLALPGMQPWRESSLVVTVGGQGTALSSGSVALNSGQLQFDIGQERLVADLAQPIPDLMKASTWTARGSVTGSLARWLAHAGTFVDLSFLKTDGKTQLVFDAVLDSQQLSLNNIQYQIQDWTFDGYGMTIREPEVSGTGRLQYDLSNGQIRFPELTLASSSIAARGDTILMDMSQFLDISGNVAFRGDTHRILNWFGMFSEPDSIHYFGGLEGQLAIKSTSQGMGGELLAKITDFVAAQPTVGPDNQNQWSELLREPSIDIRSAVGLRSDFDQLTFQNLKATSESIQLAASGSLSDLANRLQADIQGTWSPDWQRVQKLLDAYTYQLVQLTGRHDQSFSVKGPLLGSSATEAWPPMDLMVSSQLGWQEGVVCLLPIGAADINASLAQGIAKLDTGVIPFSGGQVTLAPEYNLFGEQQLVLNSGPIATDINLTPEICRDWMKFVAPLIADVTSAQGKISIETAGIHVPLADLNQAQGRGTITLSDVTVGPGPLGMKLIETVDLIKSMLKPGTAASSQDRSVWLRLESQSVPMAVANGRIHHNDMKITVKDVTLKTTGSVGFDQTLSMTAEIPILDDWIKDQAWLEPLKGQTIKVPITGTVTNPKLDVKSIRDMSMNLVQRTAANKLNNVVNQQTEKLQNKVDGELGKVQEKVGGELNKIQDKLGGQINKAQSDVTEKVQGEVLKGLNNLFGPKKK